MRYAPVAMCLLALCLAGSASAGSNPLITYPLHAHVGQGGTCAAILAEVNCLPIPQGGLRPRISVNAGESFRLGFFMANYVAVAGVQTAFDWPAGWTLDDAPGMGCRSGEVTGDLPAAGEPGGPITGSFVLAFNCVTTGTSAMLGRMDMTAGQSGCLEQIQSGYPFGTHAQDCTNGRDLIPNGARLGKICIGAGGIDACDPVSAVEPATWGNIKASYK